MGRLFGTEGAGGVANGELTCGLAMSIGQAAVRVMGAKGSRPRVLIGKDPRVSSDMLEAALTAGFCSAGAEVRQLGVIPTAGVACLVRRCGADGGVMITASGSPCEMNGIKLFNREGAFLSRRQEEEIEATVLDGAGEIPCPSGGEVGRVLRLERAAADYVRELIGTVPGNLRGMKLAVDCAGGAASVTARRLFEGLGAECTFLNDSPDGVNINRACGADHPEALAEWVKSRKLFGGVAFDGGGERCVAVDEQGNLLDGDRILFALAADRSERGLPNGVVADAASNLGLLRSCSARGIRTAAADQESRRLWEEMDRTGYPLGGDASGSLILRDFSSCPDGQLTALQLLSLCRVKGCKLSRLGGLMERYPRVVLNVRADAAQKAAFLADENLAAAVRAADDALGEDGRILIRPSGTEPLIRVTVEGKDFDRVNQTAVALADLIRAETAYESGN